MMKYLIPTPKPTVLLQDIEVDRAAFQRFDSQMTHKMIELELLLKELGCKSLQIDAARRALARKQEKK